MRRYLLVHPDMGVFIGHSMGIGFWSKLDSLGQTYATTWERPEYAHAFASTWPEVPDGLTTVEVDAFDDGSGFYYASMAACIAAGVPGWLDESTPTIGSLQ